MQFCAGMKFGKLQSLVISGFRVLSKGLFVISLLTILSAWNLPTAAAETVDVTVGGGPMILAFEPAQIEVHPGDQVHFKIGAGAPHNAVFEGTLSDLTHKNLEMAGDWNITIPDDAAPGTYEYYCEPHRGAGMIGKITVAS